MVSFTNNNDDNDYNNSYLRFQHPKFEDVRNKETRCQGQETLNHEQNASTPKLMLTGFISQDLTEEKDCYSWNFVIKP